MNELSALELFLGSSAFAARFSFDFPIVNRVGRRQQARQKVLVETLHLE
jgi:hypothetical protein